ncbi:glycoside hydrolase family 3 protein [Labedaea rhizosphaerae]|uniref:beta-N-acetylhexosaminidase n=1 Tax=Labedaea rhizosphaerae TaxID=598644 RepID=A0A4R6SDE9_LABRH|nr:glycoside hydrolase family 3 protein [Labedaea rhizosphaerae]TDP97892.1 beta-N-acetylhexosaminidase [Labedaea rhizosphaerae]
MVLRRLTALLAVTGTAAAAFALPSATAAAKPTSLDSRIKAAMASMTLEEKVGQMFVTYAYGSTADTTTAADVAQNQALYGADVHNGAELVRKYHLGGIIYFAWSNNLQNPQQIGALSNGLQQTAMSAANPIPLQISTDQEGGTVTRILSGAVSPGNMAIGATHNPVSAYSAAAVTGSELRAMGINLDDAPVVDVNTNPRNSADGPRSFGDRTLAVSLDSAAAVAGYQNSGVAAQAKHFPGLGDTEVNTDNGVAVTNETREQLMSIDVPPFRAAIAAGTKSIMAAHIVAPALDPSGAPASLSKPMITGILRDQLHFDGVVATDSLGAGALADIPKDQIILRAVDAGDDELLMPESLPIAYDALLNAVKTGAIPESRIDQSVYRLLRMKFEEGLFDNPYTTADKITATVGAPAHMNTMASIAQKSITLLRNQDGVLPIAANSGKHVLVAGWGSTTTRTLTDALTAKGLTVQRFWTGNPSQATIDAAVAAAKANDLTVVTSYNAWGDTTQQSLINQLLATGKPVVVVSIGGPYDIAYYPSAPTYLATYGYQAVSMNALANTLTGTEPTGKLPVTIRSADGTTTLFKYGSGSGF